MYENQPSFKNMDIDESISLRKELIAKAKEIDLSAPWSQINSQILDLRKTWRKIQYFESAIEEELEEEFEAILHVPASKHKEAVSEIKKQKEHIISEAKLAANLTNFKEATQKMNDLMEAWKSCQRIDKETDDQLWEAFNNERQKLFDKKNEYFKDLQSKFASNKALKEELITKAETLCHSEDFKEAIKQSKELFEQWKKIGSAGNQHDQELWERFNGYRDEFYQKYSQYREELEKTFQANYAKKMELVAKAQEVLAANFYSKENTQIMKDLMNTHKTIANASKELDDKAWAAFKQVQDDYFANMKAYNENKKEQWKERMLQSKQRKEELISKQKRQIDYLNKEMVYMLSESQVADAKLEIEEKQRFIQELEEQIKDIEAKLQ
ncbi:MAG: DUF349 domain-containing protein [Erysipelotrichaceae bacterium]|nr:DUF349 domain-containing protein [Erysipelotrichaceae bacterium]